MDEAKQEVPETKSKKEEHPEQQVKVGEIDSLDPNVDQDLMRLSGGY